MALRLAALWLALVAQADPPGKGGAGGSVIADALEVLDEPSDSAYESATLKRGDRIRLIRPSPADLPAGWLAIEAPPGSFDWIDAGSIRVGADGAAEVVADRARIRSGSPGAQMPGPPRPPLPRGSPLQMVDRPSLTVGEGGKTRSWKAIEPQAGQARFVRLGAIRLDPGAEPPKPPEPSPTIHLDPAVEPAQARNQAGGGSSAEDAIRRFEDAVRRSRSLDADAAEVRRTLADARAGTDRAYDARGLLQASSRRVDGEKVHALIGPEGVPIAYLAIPPGVSIHRLLSRKVGVRGDVHFNETLGARLITVRDLDPLDRPR